MNEKLYAWADTVISFISDNLPAEHTWVTSFKPNDINPTPAHGDYWYCHGDTRESATLIQVGTGGMDFARTIGVSHDRNDCAGIVYAKDGVCHQIANRLLRFSTNEDSKTATVKKAKGYVLSVGMYGKYGDKRLAKISKARRERVANWEYTVEQYKLNRRQ